MKTSELKKLFLDICNGFSYSKVLNAYIKHPTLCDIVICEEAKEKAIEHALDYGLLKEEDILKECIKNGSWSVQKANSLKSIEEDYRRLNLSRFHPVSKQQLTSLREELQAIENEWMLISREKHSLLNNSAEKYGERAFNDKELSILLFQDIKLTQPLFTDEDFEYLDDREFAKISREIHYEASRFSGDNINVLSIEMFIQRRMTSSILDFFGKPTCELTDYQISLFNLSEKFKAMLEDVGEVPEEYQTPEGIEDYYYLKKANALPSPQEIAKNKSMWD